MLLIIIFAGIIIPYLVITYPLEFFGVSQATMFVIHSGFVIYIGLLLLWGWYEGESGKYEAIAEERRATERRIADRIAERFKKNEKN